LGMCYAKTTKVCMHVRGWGTWGGQYLSPDHIAVGHAGLYVLQYFILPFASVGNALL
jgi:hypothetical protein